MGGFDLIKGIENVGRSMGQELGGGVGRVFGGKRGESAGRNIGGSLGAVGAPLAAATLAFRTGGRVNDPRKKKGAPVKIVAHNGEFILPIGVKPTVAQKKAVAKRKADEKKKK